MIALSRESFEDHLFYLIRNLRSTKKDRYRLAVKNKLVDQYIETASHAGIELGVSTSELERRRVRRLEFNEVLADVLNILKSCEGWVLFKTAKPFIYTPTDIDLLTFTPLSHRRVLSKLFHAGYRPFDDAPFTTTLIHPASQIVVDVYFEIAASHFIYCDKAPLFAAKNFREVEGVTTPMLLEPSALLIVMLHAVYKEQLFTLADYWMTLDHLGNFGSEDVEAFVALVEEGGSRHGVYGCLAAVKALSEHPLATGDIQAPQVLDVLLNKLSPRLHRFNHEVRRIVSRKEAPVRFFSFPFMLPCIYEKGRSNPRARWSFLKLAAEAAWPFSIHSRSFYRELGKHVGREHY